MASPPRLLLVDQVYQYLLAQLAARALALGTHLNAIQIAAELGTSRTTVNKAITRLQEEGWVQADTGRRPVVVAHPHGGPADEPVAFTFANQTERTYEAVLERVLRGDFRPGETIKERRLAQELGVNPVTVHRAAEWLCNDGLLVRLRRRGWQMVALHGEDLKDLYHVRQLLEPRMLREAAHRLPDQALDELEAETDRLIRAGDQATVFERRQADYHFHRTLAQASGRRILADTLDALIRRSLLMTTVAFRFGRVTRSFEEHKAVLDALRRRDAAGAVRCLKEHLRSALKHNLANWQLLEQAGTVAAAENS